MSDRAEWDLNFEEEVDPEDLSAEELFKKFEEIKRESVVKRGPKGRNKPGAKLVSITFKMDEVQAAIVKKLCGKRGLDPRYEDHSHFFRDATWSKIREIIDDIHNEKLTTLYIASAAEQDAVDMKALLTEQYSFSRSMEEARKEFRFDQEALDMLKSKVEAYISTAATEPIKRRLRKINWKADERDDYS